MKKNTSKKFVLAMLLLSIIGVTAVAFGYFTVERLGDKSNAISGKAVKNGPKMSYSENKEGITLTGTYPMPDELGAHKSDEYKFTIRNEENKTVKAKIIMEVTKDSDLDDSLVNISINGVVVTLGTLTRVDPSNGFRNAYVLKETTLTGGKQEENTLKMWLNENGTKENAQNKVWASRILVVPEFVK